MNEVLEIYIFVFIVSGMKQMKLVLTHSSSNRAAEFESNHARRVPADNLGARRLARPDVACPAFPLSRISVLSAEVRLPQLEISEPFTMPRSLNSSSSWLGSPPLL